MMLRLKRDRFLVKLGAAFFLVVVPSASIATSAKTNSAASRAANSSAIETKLFVQLFKEAHYNRDAVKEADFADLVQEFMASLDERRVVFLQSDRDALTRQIGPALHWNLAVLGDLGAATSIFDAYRARSAERVKWISRQLHGELTLDTNEVVDRPREPFSWPNDARTADGIWLRRLQAEVIDEVLNGRSVDEAKTILQKRYENWLASIAGVGSREIGDRFLATMAHRYDAHSTYYGPEEFKDFGAAMRSDLVGIGLELTTRDGRCLITDVLSGGPAAGSRVSPGDEIVAVGDERDVLVDVHGFRLRQIVGLTRGKPGTEVRLVTHPASAVDPSIRLTTKVTRGRVSPDAMRAWARVFHMSQESDAKSAFAVVTLGSFYGEITTADGSRTSASRDVAQLLEKLKGEAIHGLVLDLRGNGGGYLTEAAELLGLFIGKRPAFVIRNYSGENSIVASKNETLFTGPLVVLVDSRSASASEIVAGVLQEYGRAVVVGSPTVGMGSVQTVLELRNLSPVLARSPDGSGAARLTIQRVFMPSGASTQLVGVTPDVVLPSLAFAATYERDLLHPLSSERISGSEIPAKPLPTETLDLVRAKSADRQRVLPDLIAAQQAADRFTDAHQHSVLINLDRRRQLQAEQGQQEQMAQNLKDPDSMTPSASFDLSSHLGAGKTGSDEASTITDDCLLRESLRILRDLSLAGWSR